MILHGRRGVHRLTPAGLSHCSIFGLPTKRGYVFPNTNFINILLLPHARRPSCLMSSTSPSNLTPCKAVTSPQSWLPTAQCKTLNAFVSCQMLASVLPAADCESYLSSTKDHSKLHQFSNDVVNATDPAHVKGPFGIFIYDCSMLGWLYRVLRMIVLEGKR